MSVCFTTHFCVLSIDQVFIFYDAYKIVYTRFFFAVWYCRTRVLDCFLSIFAYMDISKASAFLGKRVFILVDRPMGSLHPRYGYVYPVNYGFVPDTVSPDGEELDAYVLGVCVPRETFEGVCIAYIHRMDDDDDKLIVVPDGASLTDAEIRNATDFQEKYFSSSVVRADV
jgi:inorganic pyrophosphatase